MHILLHRALCQLDFQIWWAWPLALKHCSLFSAIRLQTGIPPFSQQSVWVIFSLSVQSQSEDTDVVRSERRFPRVLHSSHTPLDLLIGNEHHNIPGSQAQEGGHEAVGQMETVLNIYFSVNNKACFSNGVKIENHTHAYLHQNTFAQNGKWQFVIINEILLLLMFIIMYLFILHFSYFQWCFVAISFLYIHGTTESMCALFIAIKTHSLRIASDSLLLSVRFCYY